mgnify:CR=1 FL=1
MSDSLDAIVGEAGATLPTLPTRRSERDALHAVLRCGSDHGDGEDGSPIHRLSR